MSSPLRRKISRRWRSPLSKTRRGFTLVEILVVVAIIVILMAILIPVAMNAIAAARRAATGVEISQLKAALDELAKPATAHAGLCTGERRKRSQTPPAILLGDLRRLVHSEGGGDARCG